LKQVYHLYNFIEPLLKNIGTTKSDFSLVDHGAGKSYLGFILYDLFFKDHKSGHIFGIETRDELVLKSKNLARECQFERMHFLNLSVEESMTALDLPETIDIVTALHACNTATDDAIKFGLQKKSQYMVIVPCCQAEVASVLKKNKASLKSALSEIWRHPLHTREFGSQLTNVLRCLQLEAHGYQVTVTELVGWEHSMKNELIIAKYNPDTNKKKAAEKLSLLLEDVGLIELKERFFIP
ncbi:MAG: SAM-dependent methyltransferase, partial [Bdellovibrionales bacterium]|nr:SAM-dependent methyltransferase [Bdellovibrionales bacterium]